MNIYIHVYSGAKYKRHASLILPLFRRSKIISNLNIIINCTDKLLLRWRARDNASRVHLDMIEQCQHLLLSIIGFIAFNYDLQTLENEENIHQNELGHALQVYLQSYRTVFYLPKPVARIYMALNRDYQKSLIVLRRYVHSIIEETIQMDQSVIAEQKRTNLIATLVGSLQQDERSEATKAEEDKIG